MQNINDKTLHGNPFEDIVEAALSFNLIIDEENDTEELKYCKLFKIYRVFLFYNMRKESQKFYKRPPLLNAPPKNRKI